MDSLPFLDSCCDQDHPPTPHSPTHSLTKPRRESVSPPVVFVCKMETLTHSAAGTRCGRSSWRRRRSTACWSRACTTGGATVAGTARGCAGGRGRAGPGCPATPPPPRPSCRTAPAKLSSTQGSSNEKDCCTRYSFTNGSLGGGYLSKLRQD